MPREKKDDVIKKMSDGVVPPRSVRRIPLSQTTKKVTIDEYNPAHSTNIDDETENLRDVIRKTSEPKHRSRNPVSEDNRVPHYGRIIFVGIIVLVFGIALATYVFDTATVNIVVKSRTQTIDTPFTLSDATVPYTVVTLTEDKSEAILGKRGDFVQTKAKGIITLYNNFGPEAQQLVINTRVQVPGGSLYRLTRAVTVPGTKIVGGITQPGTVDVEVIADQVGPQHNLALSTTTIRMNIPGFQGTARFDSFYGIPKTDITGGFSGIRNTIDPNTEKMVIDKLSQELYSQLIEKAKSLDGHQDQIYGFATDIIPQISSTGSEDKPQVIVGVRATLYVPIIKQDDLIRNLVKVSDIGEFDITQSTLVLSSTQSTSTRSNQLSRGGAVPVFIKGSVTIVGSIDKAGLARALSGIKKESARDVFAKYPAIESAVITIRPLWRKTLPYASEAINIVIKDKSNHD